MNNKQEEETTKRKRNLGNTTHNQENYDSISERNEPNQNFENQNQIQNNINQQVNIEVPSALTNDPIISNTNQVVNPQRIINYNPIMNQQGQFQQIQIPNSNIIQNQMSPQIVVINIGEMKTTGKCEPTKLICPYCQSEVTSVPNISWTCKSCNSLCELIVFIFITCGLGFLCFLCELCCDYDFCCYEADHLCPKCKNIIAKRRLNNHLQNFYDCLCKDCHCR